MTNFLENPQELLCLLGLMMLTLGLSDKLGNFNYLYIILSRSLWRIGAKYSRVDKVNFVEESL